MTDSAGTTVFVYYPNGWVSAVIYDYSKSGLTALQELQYTYYPDGSRASMTWFNGTTRVGTWTYSYDAAGRLTGLSNPWNETTGWQYDEVGKLLGQTNANGTNTAYTYNDLSGWQVSSATMHGPNIVFAQRVYRSTLIGQTMDWANSQTVTSRTFYFYDDLSRLFGFSYHDVAHPENNSDPRYGYDLAGNLLTVNGSAFATYDAANKISGLSGGAIAYDGDGNVTNLAGTNIPTGLWTWDDRSLLTSAAANGATAYYDYNAGGMRVRSLTGNLSPTFYIYDGATLVGEVQHDSNTGQEPLRAAYTWGANGPVSERTSDGRSLWYAFDVQGATRALTDSAGAVVDTYQYTPFGTTTQRTGTDPNPFCYGGQAGYYTDAANPTGTILCGLRWYDPALGRWLSRDPIGYGDGPNLYAYCDNNPVMELDPSGKDAYVYTLFGKSHWEGADSLINWVVGTHSMLAVDTPMGPILADFAGSIRIRYATSDSKGRLTPINLHDCNSLYDKPGLAVSAHRTKLTKQQDLAILKHIIGLTGEKLSVDGFLNKLKNDSTGELSYSESDTPAQKYGSYNVFDNQCTTFVANLLRSSGAPWLTPIWAVSPRALSGWIDGQSHWTSFSVK